MLEKLLINTKDEGQFFFYIFVFILELSPKCFCDLQSQACIELHKSHLKTSKLKDHFDLFNGHCVVHLVVLYSLMSLSLLPAKTDHELAGLLSRLPLWSRRPGIIDIKWSPSQD